jgi:putative addiction module killer protein
LTVLEYLDRAGSSPFAAWFRSLDATAAAKVTTALRRLELGNFSNVKGVGAGVFEYRIDFGPGYGVYFGWRHCRDSARWRDEEAPGQGIADAHVRWADYKKRKAQEK